MRINQNMAALNAWRNLTSTDGVLNRSLERLSSGYRINRAADDAAGLAISEKMRGQIKGLNQAVANAQNGISLIQTAEGALNEVHSILQRMRELAVQSASDTMTDSDRTELQKEVDNLLSEIDRIGSDTEFNTKKLLNGSLTSATTAQGTVLKSVQLNFNATTVASGATTVASLLDSNGNSLGLASGDTIAIEGYINGTYVSGSFSIVSATNAVNSLLTKIGSVLQITAGSVSINASGLVVIGGDNGTAERLFSVKLSATNRTLFNDKLSNFEETQAAQDSNIDSALSIQIGANANQTTNVGISDMRKAALALSSISVSTRTGAQNTINVIDRALSSVSSQRSGLGAVQNRLQYTIANVGVAAENLSASESRIRDVDMSREMTEFTRSQILMQAGTSMLAQANQKTQNVLQLLR